MWELGEQTDVEHCQHCSPMVWWLSFNEGKPPQLAYKGFPPDGQIVLSKKKVVVFCAKCALPSLSGSQLWLHS
jgi:hypothetical protein